MEEQLDKILKALKYIKPEDGFVRGSRQFILSSEQKPMRFGLSLIENMKLGAALALASLLLFIALGGIAYLSGDSSPMMANSENNAEEGFTIQLGEAQYNLGNDVEVGQVDEIFKN